MQYQTIFSVGRKKCYKTYLLQYASGLILLWRNEWVFPWNLCLHVLCLPTPYMFILPHWPSIARFLHTYIINILNFPNVSTIIIHGTGQTLNGDVLSIPVHEHRRSIWTLCLVLHTMSHFTIEPSATHIWLFAARTHSRNKIKNKKICNFHRFLHNLGKILKNKTKGIF